MAVGAKGCVLWVLTLGLAVAMRTAGAPPADAPPPPSVDCSSALISLAECLPFVEDGSNEPAPQKGCCSGLKKVVEEQPSCLCDTFKHSAEMGIQLNKSKALALPSSCGVSTPPKCENIADDVPVAAAPVKSPSAGGRASMMLAGGVPSPAPGVSSSMNCIPSFGHFAGVALAMCFYYWL